jgi:hypothetical protein
VLQWLYLANFADPIPKLFIWDIFIVAVTWGVDDLKDALRPFLTSSLSLYTVAEVLTNSSSPLSSPLLSSPLLSSPLLSSPLLSSPLLSSPLLSSPLRCS